MYGTNDPYQNQNQNQYQNQGYQPQPMFQGNMVQPNMGQPNMLVQPLVIQQNIPQMLFQPKMTGFQKLATVPGIFFKQKFRPCQALTGCELQNRYFVYALDQDGKSKKGTKMFKCKETSECCQRQFCSPHCRTFSMNVNNKDYLDQGNDGTPFLQFERPFKCSFLCLERPEMAIRLKENGNDIYIGKVKNPFKCCDLIGEIYNANDELKYTIEGSCCQCGIICEGPLCQAASLNIMSGGQVVGSLNRVMGSIAKNCFNTNASFAVTFPINATAEDRALFIGATIMIDYAYFEKKNKGAITQ
jgi:hypothetical protein